MTAHPHRAYRAITTTDPYRMDIWQGLTNTVQVRGDKYRITYWGRHYGGPNSWGLRQYTERVPREYARRLVRALRRAQIGIAYDGLSLLAWDSVRGDY